MLNTNLLRATLISGAVAVFGAGAFVPAQAEDGRNAAAVAGAIGGLAAGAAIGSAGPRPGCRMVVTKRVNRFGERVTTRREICD
jgi:hypothetical protein